MNLISQDAIDVERWRRIESVLDLALDLPPHEVQAFLDHACAGSPELRGEIEALLEADRRASKFLAVPAAMLVSPFDDGTEPGLGAEAVGAPEAATPAAPPPERIGRYRVLGELGRGGMGIVYRCLDASYDREVAIKALPSGVAKDPERLERFLREAKLLGALHHPNIAGIHGIEQAGGQRYLILERVQGSTLSVRLRAGPLPLREALDVCAQIADALAAAHALGIVHRDLKPGNVMRTPDGLVKVLDFGLAMHVSQDLREPARSPATRVSGDRTMTGARLGTPGYMSPEQILGLDQDSRADLFALGVVLYECLAGARAFTGGSVYAVIAATLNAPVDARRLPAETPEPVRALLARALEKDPARRIVDARGAAAVLSAAVADTTVRPGRAPPGALGTLRLPEATTPMVGREREIADARGLLARVSLVTLVGAAGCGKTRLAVEIARAAHGSSADETWFADLAEASDAAAVAAAIAAAADLRDPSEPLLESGLLARLGGRRALLVLDNCDRALGFCAALTSRLLARLPGLSVLATSREWLGASGEQTLRVAPLPVPDTESPPTRDAAGAAESVRLFVACANLAAGGFRLTDANAGLVAGICRDLDGVPLAIELTAALLRGQTLEQVSEGLRRWRGHPTLDAAARHDALLAAIELSYDRLSDDERRFFRGLSVFSGGWNLEAAAAVCGEDADPFATLDRLTRLVDKSLVVIQRADRIEPRYRFLESIHHFAATRCEALHEGLGLRSLHVRWFLDLAERAAPSLLSGSDQARCLALLEADHPNLLAALRACESAPDHAPIALRLAGSVWLFWYVRGHFARGREALAKALGLRGADAPTPARAQALFAAGGLAVFQGDFTEGRRLSRLALELYESLGEELGVARSLSHLALCESGEGRYDEARDATERAIAIFRAAGDARRLSAALNNLGALKRQQGDYRGALPDHEEALELLRRAADRDGMIVTLVNLGLAAARLGHQGEAGSRVVEALALVRDLRAKRAGAAALEVAAEVLASRGLIEDGVRALGAAKSLRSTIGLTADPWWRATQVVLAEHLRVTIGAERFEQLVAEGGALGFERAIEDARLRLEPGNENPEGEPELGARPDGTIATSAQA